MSFSYPETLAVFTQLSLRDFKIKNISELTQKFFLFLLSLCSLRLEWLVYLDNLFLIFRMPFVIRCTDLKGIG